MIHCMRSFCLSALATMALGCFTFASTPCTAGTEGEVNEFDVEKISQTFGHLIGQNLDSPGFSFDLESIIRGMRDAVEGKEAPMSEEEYELAIQQIQEKAFHEMAMQNLRDAEEFMAQNKSSGEVIEIVPDKLQYTVSQEGSGATVEEHSAPMIHYTGKYLDGTVFGSSQEMNEPIALPLDQTISGFGQGIVGMKEGEKRTIYIHPDMGYGSTGHLAPNSLLIFDVEVISASAPMEKAGEAASHIMEDPSEIVQ